MFNKATLIGRIGQDIELRSLKSGMSVCEISLATSERRKKGEEWVDHTEWHRVVFFGKTAETLARFKAKGDVIFVEGRIQTTEYETKEGQKAKQTKIICDNLRMFGGDKKDDAGSKKQDKKEPTKKKAEKTESWDDYGGSSNFDDDIPF